MGRGSTFILTFSPKGLSIGLRLEAGAMGKLRCQRSEAPYIPCRDSQGLAWTPSPRGYLGSTVGTACWHRP